MKADSVCREACEGYSTLLEGGLLDSKGEDEAKAKRAEGPPTYDPDRLIEYFTFWAVNARSLEEKHLPGLSGTLALEKYQSLYAMRESWESLIGKHPMAQSPKARARIRLHMGLLALEFFRGGTEKTPHQGAERNQGLHLADLFRARRDIEESLRLEEGSLAAWQALASILELSGGKKSDLNRHMERMAARFPEDGATQEKLALDCASRSAFGKAIQYLDKARALNPLDRGLVRLETLIRIEQGMSCFFRQKSKDPRSLEQGRRAFRNAMASAETKKGPASEFGGRNWVLLLWYLAECWVGEDTAARELRGQWDISAPLPLYFAGFHLADQWRLRPQQEEFKNLFSQALNRPATPEEVEGLIRFWKEWRASPLSPYAEGSLSRHLYQIHALLEKAFVRNTPPWAYLPLLRHMYDTLGSLTVSRHCAHLLKWHSKDFPLRCLLALSALLPGPDLLRDLKKEALEKGEKEWAAKLEARIEGTARIPEVFGI